MEHVLSKDERRQVEFFDRAASLGYLQSTIDRHDGKGLKCEYIDLWSQHYIRRFVPSGTDVRVLEIGCGGGRNLIHLANRIDRGYGIDIAPKQIENAETRKREYGIRNLEFATSPDSLSDGLRSVDTVFTMWMLPSFEDDGALVRCLLEYRRACPAARRFIFFEQAANGTYIEESEGQFWKKVRTVSDYAKLFAKCGLAIIQHEILNEKGFGPFYKTVYMTPLYKIWPTWLRVNPMLFWADRLLVKRRIADEFTDCVFVCEPTSLQ